MFTSWDDPECSEEISCLPRPGMPPLPLDLVILHVSTSTICSKGLAASENAESYLLAVPYVAPTVLTVLPFLSPPFVGAVEIS